MAKEGERASLCLTNKSFLSHSTVEELVLAPITAESLMSEKGFSKQTKKQSKAHETLRKKQRKEKESVAVGQCKAFDKVAAKAKK